MKHPSYVLDADLAATIRAWRDADPDPGCVVDLDHLVQRARRGDDEALTELLDAFNGSLQFGTAGLRGRMAPGPNRMNTAVVRRAAYALAHSLVTDTRICVIGYDGRHRSQHFATESARVLTAAGWTVYLMPRALPTPLLAFAIRHLAPAASHASTSSPSVMTADLGIMVTASHNPPEDNGYKVYLGDGRQIVEPLDQVIAAAMADAPPALQIPTAEGWHVLDDGIVEDYLSAASAVVHTDTPRELTVVHTGLHGVGSAVFASALQRAGFASPIEVSEQEHPDPQFPTVAFPNPEEPGALDLALATARASAADIVIAHDPDADRCAVAVPRPDGWGMLTGDEVGALLGWWLIARGERPAGTFANSLVSDTLLGAIAADAGIPFAVTLTGFKWISRVPDLAYGYEEALGYCVDPVHVADKDGITAGLLVAELAAHARSTESSLIDILNNLHRRFGLHLTRQVTVRLPRREDLAPAMATLLAHPPDRLAGLPVDRMEDLADGLDGLPPTPGLLLTAHPPPPADTHARVLIRPSGTEPKVKAYLQVHAAPDLDPGAARPLLENLLDQLEVEIAALLAPGG